jgi:uncharacterized protein
MSEAVGDRARAEIGRRLEAIEVGSDVRILFACESGSRAWGFASTDSDYDVRFLYVRRPDWYLSVDFEEKPDVIETPLEGDWDVDGWDLRKALRLFRKSNPVLLEWLQSPIVYRQAGGAVRSIRELVPVLFSPRAAMHHYLGMAKKNYHAHLKEELVRRKKYLYVLRPMFACGWLERNLGPIPVEFEKLVASASLPNDVVSAIRVLLEEKRAGTEAGLGRKVPVLNQLIERELTRLDSLPDLGSPKVVDVAKLNDVFRNALSEAWGWTGR